MTEPPTDIVDRRKGAPVHGHTWHHTVDGLLDELSRLHTERDNAMTELIAFLREHPEHDQDDHLTVARLALL